MADIDLLVLNTINASLRRPIDAPTVIACLLGRQDCEPWAEHLRIFFQDVSREALFRFMLAHHLDARALLRSYRALVPPDERAHGDLDAWLTELANAA